MNKKFLITAEIILYNMSKHSLVFPKYETATKVHSNNKNTMKLLINLNSF